MIGQHRCLHSRQCNRHQSPVAHHRADWAGQQLGFNAPATISLAANVTANGHTITKVQFYNGATLLGEATTVLTP